MTNLKTGDTVFFIDHWNGHIIKGTVETLLPEGANVHCNAIVDENGNKVEDAYGTGGARFEKLYASAKDAYDAKKKLREEAVNKYCDEIGTIADLVSFPLNHCLCGEEYTDYPAIEAYKIRAKELTGIDL